MTTRSTGLRGALLFLLGPAALAAAAGFNVRDYGAVGDGRTLETAAFRRAVAACATAGGGEVTVPPGRYLTGTIELKSRVALEVDAGAVILGSENPEDYPPAENVWGDVTITNCVMYRGHGGVTIGSETWGSVRNVTITNCVFHGTDTGIRIKSQRGRGGIVEGLIMDGVVMEDVAEPFQIATFYLGHDQPGELHPVDEGTPRYRDLHFGNITARGARRAGSITGLREMPIEDITFSHVRIQAAAGFTCTNAREVAFYDSTIDTSAGPALMLRQSHGIDTARLRTLDPHAGVPLVTDDSR